MKDSMENRDDLIAKVLSGEANQEEISELETWKNQSKDNLSYFDICKKLFREIDGSRTLYEVDTDSAWKKLDSRISNEHTKIIPLFKKRTVLRIAASIVLLALLGIIIRFISVDNTTELQMFATVKQALEKNLPDGSKVFINKNSEISYTVNKDNIREVKLKGEAFFDVVHNEEQPFIIMVDEILIKDIGTSFNVKATPGNNTIEILVEDGEVQFYSAENLGLKLIKGEKAIYNKSTKQFSKISLGAIDNTLSYKTKIFHFNGTTLKNVIMELNEVYSTDIQFSDEKIGDCNLSVVFNNEKIDEIVSIIAETLNLEIERKGQTIILKGETCIER